MAQFQERPELPKRCLSCLYILEGLSESRCPECGQRFDPADPRSFARGRPAVWRRWCVRHAALILTVTAGTVLLVLGGSLLREVSAVEVCTETGAVLEYREVRLGGLRLFRLQECVTPTGISHFLSSHRAQNGHRWCVAFVRQVDRGGNRRNPDRIHSDTLRLLVLHQTEYSEEALRRLEASIPEIADMIHRDILNERNEGKALARANLLRRMCHSSNDLELRWLLYTWRVVLGGEGVEGAER